MTMIRGETPAPVRHQSAAGDQRCESAKENIADLLASGRTLGDEQDLRQHLSSCEDCNALYRELLLADARLRRTLVECDGQLESHSHDAGMPRRAVLSPVAVARAGFSAAGRGKASWVVVLGIVFYAAVRLTPDPAGIARAQLSAVEGSVLSVGEPLVAGEPTRNLQRGDWVRTPENSRAQLQLGTTRIEVAPSSVVQIEEPSTYRLRLESGSLDVQGRLIVTSLFGIVQVEDGDAVLSIDSRGMFVESTHGTVRTIDSRGERQLGTGETRQLTLAR